MSILLDTHVALRLLQDDRGLGRSAKDAIRESSRSFGVATSATHVGPAHESEDRARDARPRPPVTLARVQGGHEKRHDEHDDPARDADEDHLGCVDVQRLRLRNDGVAAGEQLLVRRFLESRLALGGEHDASFVGHRVLGALPHLAGALDRAGRRTVSTRRALRLTLVWAHRHSLVDAPLTGGEAPTAELGAGASDPGRASAERGEGTADVTHGPGHGRAPDEAATTTR